MEEAVDERAMLLWSTHDHLISKRQDEAAFGCCPHDPKVPLEGACDPEEVPAVDAVRPIRDGHLRLNLRQAVDEEDSLQWKDRDDLPAQWVRHSVAMSCVAEVANVETHHGRKSHLWY